MQATKITGARRFCHLVGRSAVTLGAFVSLASLVTLTGCPKDDAQKDQQGTPPPPAPPPSATATANACANAGTDPDAISAPFFPQTLQADGAPAYCLDAKSDVKTYGDKGKLTVDEFCTTGVDGECEVYKRFGLKRVAIVAYVDGAGKGSTVKATLSQYNDAGGAYGMYSKRVIADSDPTDPTAPKPITGINKDAAGAIGSGSAYMWKNDQLLELEYNNENESPDDLKKSSAPVLAALAKNVADRLPTGVTPAAVTALPTDKRVANGVQYYTNDLLGMKGQAGALGYYQDGSKRWRGLAITAPTTQAATDVFNKQFKGHAGALPIPAASIGGTGIDDAVHVVIEVAKDEPKTEWLVVRRGTEIDGVGDEEYALKAATAPADVAKARLSKDDAVALIKAWSAKAPLSYSAGVPAPGSPAPAAADAGTVQVKGSIAPPVH